MIRTPTRRAPAVTAESTRALLVSNLLAVGAALLFQWPLGLLLWPYWVQNLVIGWYSRRRILALRRFSTEGVRINDRAVAPTPETQRWIANFLVLHFGFFHLGYLTFLLVEHASLPWWEWAGIAFLAVSFARSHRLSFHQNVEADSRGVPNIGTLMFLPYARVVPMHLAVILGGAAGGDATWAVLVFGALKTGADLVMHHVEHRLLQGSPRSTDEPTGEAPR